jgi:hypothetical protein
VKMDSVLGSNSYVSIGFAVAVIGGLTWINVNITRLQVSAEASREELAQVKARLASLESKREGWGYNEMYKWTGRLQRSNPKLNVPEVEP